MSKREIGSLTNPTDHWTKTVTATETPSSGVDVRDYGAALVLATVGAITNIANSPVPSWTLKLQESDDDSTFTDVAAADVALADHNNDGSITSGVFATIDAADEDDQCYSCSYIGTKRYIRVVATAADTPGATPISVVVARGLPHLAPAAHTG